MRLRRSARILLFDPDGDLLLIRFLSRAQGRAVTFWVTPGGEIEAGETPEEAAARELYEELGLHLPLLGPVHEEAGGEYEHLGERVGNEDVFFATVCDRGAPRLAGVTEDEIRLMQEMRWWSAEDLAAAEARQQAVYPVGLAALAARIWAIAHDGTEPAM